MAEWIKRFSLKGRTALVTGASKGICAKISRGLVVVGGLCFLYYLILMPLTVDLMFWILYNGSKLAISLYCVIAYWVLLDRGCTKGSGIIRLG
ncbi:hypothetical protein N9383_01395 [Granulosicoccus sp.]|nr:hypothetical protein [Granulosicoccus sp.]